MEGECLGLTSVDPFLGLVLDCSDELLSCLNFPVESCFSIMSGVASPVWPEEDEQLGEAAGGGKGRMLCLPASNGVNCWLVSGELRC